MDKTKMIEGLKALRGGFLTVRPYAEKEQLVNLGEPDVDVCAKAIINALLSELEGSPEYQAYCKQYGDTLPERDWKEMTGTLKSLGESWDTMNATQKRDPDIVSRTRRKANMDRLMNEMTAIEVELRY